MNAQNSFIEIFLVEDHHDFRQSLQLSLNNERKYHCTAFGKGEEMIEAFDDHAPDLVIMDINLPGMSGIECTRWIKKNFPSVQIMMCTVYEDDEKIFDALKAGANGYLLKRASLEEIFSSINDIYLGGSPMSSSIARRVVSSFQHPRKITEGDEALSVREVEILDALAEGQQIKEIASKLFISINTVRTHIGHIYKKLQVQSRIEAINKAGKSSYRK